MCSLSCSIKTFVIQTFIQSYFTSESSRYCKSQTGRAVELTFWENVHPPTICYMSCVTCQVSHVTCQVSVVKCQVSLFLIPTDFFYKVVDLVGGGSVIYGAYLVWFNSKYTSIILCIALATSGVWMKVHFILDRFHCVKGQCNEFSIGFKLINRQTWHWHQSFLWT